MIDLLAAPMKALLAELGTGVPAPGSSDDLLRTATEALTSAGETTASLLTRVAHTWSGPAAESAGARTVRCAESAVHLAIHATELRTALQEACASVARGHAELAAVIESFVTTAAASVPALASPAGQAAVVALAVDHLERAALIHARVRAELDAHAAAVSASVPPPVPGIPGVDGSDVRLADVARVAAAAVPPSAARLGVPTVDGPYGAGPGLSADAAHTSGPTAPGHRAYDPAQGGSGVSVILPDGSTALAPNERAASAVRFALEQQGTPYVWGGTTPGSGLDCSGLTQGAYQQAGVDIPRLAADQSVGAPVGQDDVMPGDLAVWDGHVAMVVGNGQLVEAGDPVQVGPIRTSNSGMTFHGFYRPTE